MLRLFSSIFPRQLFISLSLSLSPLPSLTWSPIWLDLRIQGRLPTTYRLSRNSLTWSPIRRRRRVNFLVDVIDKALSGDRNWLWEKHFLFLLRAWCVTAPLIWGNRSPVAAQIKVHSESANQAQVWASVRDAGPMVPAGLGHWSYFWWAPPPGPVGRPIPWAIHRGQPLYTHTHTHTHTSAPLSYTANSFLLPRSCIKFNID